MSEKPKREEVNEAMNSGLWTGCVGILAMLICFVVWMFMPSLFAQTRSNYETPIETYERTYAECLTRETISATQCHDIALIEAYDE